MNKKIRKQWAQQAGKSSSLGIELNIITPDLSWNIIGIVGVSDCPANDAERYYLANLILKQIPNHNIKKLAINSWRIKKNDKDQFTVTISQTKTPIIDRSMLVRDIHIFEPPDAVNPLSHNLIDSNLYVNWENEYKRNRYIRFESRKERTQRYEDIWGNVITLRENGKMDTTSDPKWFRLFQHVITEMCIKGQPPHLGNRDPDVRSAYPLKDKHLCKKAATITSHIRLDMGVLVKYGKRHHMEDLYYNGNVWMNPASSYNDSTNNIAVQDDELKLIFKGGCSLKTNPNQFLTGKDESCITDFSNKYFTSIYDTPQLTQDQYSTTKLEQLTDYWCYCMSGILNPRLFSDFDSSTACVLIKFEPFSRRLEMKMKQEEPNASFGCNYINYVDPLGAYNYDPKLTSCIETLPIYFTKAFRYAYQKEFRFVWLPNPLQPKLQHKELNVGSLKDIAELILL